MNPDDLEKLRLLANKLRCLGHFVETQDLDHVLPTDFDKVQYGFSIFLNEIATELLNCLRSQNNEKDRRSYL